MGDIDGHPTCLHIILLPTLSELPPRPPSRTLSHICNCPQWPSHAANDASCLAKPCQLLLSFKRFLHRGSPPDRQARPLAPDTPFILRLRFSVDCSRGVEFKLGTTGEWLLSTLCFGAGSGLLLSRVDLSAPRDCTAFIVILPGCSLAALSRTCMLASKTRRPVTAALFLHVAADPVSPAGQSSTLDSRRRLDSRLSMLKCTRPLCQPCGDAAHDESYWAPNGRKWKQYSASETTWRAIASMAATP
jgi:hypothetical protein